MIVTVFEYYFSIIFYVLVLIERMYYTLKTAFDQIISKNLKVFC